MFLNKQNYKQVENKSYSFLFSLVLGSVSPSVMM